MRQNFLLLPQQQHLGKAHLPPPKVPPKLHKDTATTEISLSLATSVQREDRFLEVSHKLNTSCSAGSISAAASSSVHHSLDSAFLFSYCLLQKAPSKNSQLLTWG